MIELIFQYFGGARQFDCWLNTVADQLSEASPPPPELLPGLPPEVLGLLDRPREVVDGLLDRLEKLGGWHYDRREVSGRYQLVDRIWGHIIEEGPT